MSTFLAALVKKKKKKKKVKQQQQNTKTDILPPSTQSEASAHTDYILLSTYYRLKLQGWVVLRTTHKCPIRENDCYRNKNNGKNKALQYLVDHSQSFSSREKYPTVWAALEDNDLEPVIHCSRKIQTLQITMNYQSLLLTSRPIQICHTLPPHDAHAHIPIHKHDPNI